MSHQVVIDILPIVKEHFPKSIVLPNVAQSLEEIYEGTMMRVMQDTEMLWGYNTMGGLAYFGKTEDIAKIQEQAHIYLKKLSKSSDQFYLMWELKDYSLLLLYENYQNEVENPYPLHDNVLCVYFGAWTDDEVLLSVLKEKLYSEDEFWQYGSQGFDNKDTNQKNLLKEMKKAVKLIDKSQK